MADRNSTPKPFDCNTYRGNYGKGKRAGRSQSKGGSRPGNSTSNPGSGSGSASDSFMTRAQAQAWFRQIERETEAREREEGPTRNFFAETPSRATPSSSDSVSPNIPKRSCANGMEGSMWSLENYTKREALKKQTEAATGSDSGLVTDDVSNE